MELSLLTFAILALFVVMTPGPTVLLAVSNGSRFGIGAAGFGIAGAAFSDAVLIGAAGLGLGAVLAASAYLFAVVKWIGVAYLIWLGLQMLRSTNEVGSDSVHKPNHKPGAHYQRGAIFRKSFLVAATNPKGYLFFTAFLPQFLIPTQPLFLQYVALAAVFIVIDVAVMTLYGGLGSKAVRVLSNRGALWIDRGCGCFLVALGVALTLVKQGEM